MEEQNEKYFTIWYGVFDRVRRRLSYASGGHPPAIFWPTRAATKTTCARELEVRNPPVGMMENIAFHNDTVEVGPSSRLCLFSDGAFEISKPDGVMMTLDELTDYLVRDRAPPAPTTCGASSRTWEARRPLPMTSRSSKLCSRDPTEAPK